MKKFITFLVSIVVIAAIGVGIYFIIRESNKEKDITISATAGGYVEVVYNDNTSTVLEDNRTEFKIDRDTDVQLTAIALGGYTFTGWNIGSDTSISNPYTLKVSGDITIRANFSANGYTLTLIGADGNTTEINYTNAENLLAKLNESVGTPNTGYVYQFKIGDVVVDENTTINQNVEITYEQVAIEYTVSVNTNGATETGSLSNLPNYDAEEGTFKYTIESEEITLPTDLTKNGYTFGGWKLTGEETTITGIAQGVTGDMSIEAVWTPVEYTVTVNTNGAENTGSLANIPGYNAATNTFTYTVETDTIVLPTDLTKTDYTCTGWKVTGEETIITEIVKGSFGNITIEAVWNLTQYTVSIDTKGADSIGSLANIDGYNTDTNSFTYTVETETINLPTDLTRNGYTFGGWKVVDGDTITEIAQSSRGDISIEAVWNLVQYTITFMHNGEQVGTVKYDIEHLDIAEPTIDETLDKEGYEYAWEEYTLSADNLRDFTVNSIESLINYVVTIENADQINGLADLPNYNAETGTFTYTIESETITLPTDIEREGYTFVRWEEVGGDTITEIAKGSTGNKEIRAVWNPVVYIVTFDTNGATDMGSVSSLPAYVAGENGTGTFRYLILSNTITLPTDLTKNGYTFGGWKVVDGDAITEIAQGSTGDMSIEVVWNPVEYTVTINTNGATDIGSVSNLPSYVAGENGTGTFKYTVESETITLPTDLTKTDYAFGGWKITGEETTISEISQGSTGDMSIEAVWTLTEYTVSVDTKGADSIGSLADITGYNTDTNSFTYTVETETITLPTDLTKNGYTFGGWKVVDGDTITEIAQGSREDISIEAIWNIVEYTVTINTNGATGNGSISNLPSYDALAGTFKYTVETETITLPTDLTKNGYTFGGWKVVDGDAITEIAQGSTGDKSIEVVWNIVEYTVTINTNGAENIGSLTNIPGYSTETNSFTYTVESENITLPRDLTKTNSAFIRWVEASESGETTTVNSIDTSRCENINISVVWGKMLRINASGIVSPNPNHYLVNTDLYVELNEDNSVNSVYRYEQGELVTLAENLNAFADIICVMDREGDVVRVGSTTINTDEDVANAINDIFKASANQSSVTITITYGERL